MTKESKIIATDLIAIENHVKISQITQFIKNQMNEWKQYDFIDDNLWKTFLKNFNDYTKIDFFFRQQKRSSSIENFFQKSKRMNENEIQNTASWNINQYVKKKNIN